MPDRHRHHAFATMYGFPSAPLTMIGRCVGLTDIGVDRSQCFAANGLSAAAILAHNLNVPNPAMYGCEAPTAIPVKGSGLPKFRCDRTSDGDALGSAKSPSRFADPAAASRNRCGVSQNRSAWPSHPMISRLGPENGRYTRRCLHARWAGAIVRWFLTATDCCFPLSRYRCTCTG